MAKAVAEEELANTAVPAVDMFGEFRFKVDAKGRVALPAKFRKVLSSDLVVSRELTDKCLYVFQPSGFNEWVNSLFVDKFGGYNAANVNHVKLRTKLKSRADSVEMDSAGRITLGAGMRDAVGISKNVVLVGNSGYFEIWDADAYDAMMSDIDLGMFYESDSMFSEGSDKDENGDLKLSVAR